jgi:hypothetical protein
MKDGLKQKLNDWIKNEHGQMVSIAVLESQVRLWGYKISNYERRLRPSESPHVEAVKNEHGAIVGYCWKETTRPLISMTAEEFLRRFPTKKPSEVAPQPQALF